MKRVKIVVLCIFSLIAGCAAISEQVSVDKFDKISKAYEKALLRSQFLLAQQFLDPVTVKEEIDFKKYENIKIVDYAASDLILSEDRINITQTVDIQYYWRDSYVLKSIQDKQYWRYYKEDKIWLLQTGLPIFKQ
jgi:hypothetical protein